MLTQTETLPLSVRRCGNLAELESIREDWDRLHRDSPHRHTLLDHRWACAWWRAFGKGKEMHTLVIEEDGQCRAIVPLALSKGWEAYPTRDSYLQMVDDYQVVKTPAYRRLVPIRRLSFPINVASSNLRGHALLDLDDERVYEAIMGYVASIRNRWDLLVLEGLPGESGQFEKLSAAAQRHGLRGDRRILSRPLYHLPLFNTMQDFLLSRSQHFRRRLKHACNQAVKRVADLGELEINEYRGTAIDQGMDALLSLEQRSWKVEAGRERRLHIAFDDRLRSFHCEVARAYAAEDRAAVWIMEVAAKPLAGLYCLEHNGVTTTLLTYMDKDYSNRISAYPIYRKLIESSSERGLVEVDFNSNTANIQKWTTQHRDYQRLTLYHRGLYSGFLRTLANTAWRAKRFLGNGGAKS